MSDVTKRKVSTDALETLGTIIGPDEKRDAIHLAVLPAIAGVKLLPGQSIDMKDGIANPSATGLGIVDPFLEDAVQPDERFWMILRPRLVTSLRHVWSHPSFPDEPGTEAVAPTAELTEREKSEAWIRKFAEDIDQTYNRVMSAAAEWVNYQEYTYDNSETYKDHWDKFDEFWEHYQVVTGETVKDELQHSFFTCSC